VGFNLRLEAEYGKWLADQPQPWPGPTFTPPRLGYASIRRPEAAAAFAGQLLGAAGTGGVLAFGPPVGWTQAALARDLQETGRRGSAALLATLGSAVSPLGTVSAVTLPR